MNNRILLLVIALVAVAAIFFGIKEWNRAPDQAGDVKADVVVTAAELYMAYTLDEDSANVRFNDKAVQVTGTVREVNGGGAGPVNVLLETGDPLGAVVCEFDPGSALDLKKDAQVTIKGFCAGYNLDVLLQRCAMLE